MNKRHGITFFDLLKLSLRTFRTKPLRTLLTILGMSVGISTVVFLVSLGYGLQYIMIGKLITTEDSLVTMSASYPVESGLGIDAVKIKEILLKEGVAETSAVAEFPGELNIESQVGLVPVVRVVEPNHFRLSGTKPDLGTHLEESKDEVILSHQALLLMGLQADETTLGKQVYIKIYSQTNEGIFIETPIGKPLTVVGILTDAQQLPLAMIPSSVLPISVTSYKEILIKARDIDTVEPLREELEKQGFLISARIDLVTQAKKITNIMTITLAVFGITALIVSAIGMFNTMLIGFIERTYEIGVMKSIGANDAAVRNLFLMESAVIGFLGGSGGIFIGWGLGESVGLGLNVLAKNAGGKAFELFILPLWFAVVVILLSLTIGLIAGLWPAIRASRLSPRAAFIKK